MARTLSKAAAALCAAVAVALPATAASEDSGSTTGTSPAPYTIPTADGTTTTSPVPVAPIAQLPTSAPLPSTPPPAGSSPQIPLIAALTLPARQTIKSVLANGLVVNLYAYRPVTLHVALRLTRAVARRIGRGRDRLVADRVMVAKKPGIYPYKVRLVLNRRARRGLLRLRSVTLALRSVLKSDSGRSSSTSAVKLRRR